MKYLLFTILFSATTFKNGVFAQNNRIGYISPDDVFAIMPETKKADSALAAYQQSMQQAYQERENELNSAIERFTRDSSAMTPAVREVKRNQLQSSISDLQNRQQQFNSSLEAEKERLIKPIREKLIMAIRDVARESGYAHVLYKESAIVFPEADDLTEKVRKKLGIR